MSENHVTAWLEAYHDASLSPAKQARVEAHLQTCDACRAELEALQSLSTLLQAPPPAQAKLSPERFVAQVGLRMPHRPEPTVPERIFSAVWHLVPVGVLGAWTFVQALLIVGSLVLLAQGLGLAGGQLMDVPDATPWTHELWSFSGTDPRALLPLVIQMVWGGPLDSVLVWGYILVLCLGVLYASWLASWWLRRSRNQRGVVNNA